MASRDDPLAAKMAEGMRSTRAGGAFSFGYFALGKQRKVTRSSRSETNAYFHMKINRYSNMTALEDKIKAAKPFTAICD
jgi:hypothetical protein